MFQPPNHLLNDYNSTCRAQKPSLSLLYSVRVGSKERPLGKARAAFHILQLVLAVHVVEHGLYARRLHLSRTRIPDLMHELSFEFLEHSNELALQHMIQEKAGDRSHCIRHSCVM